MASNALAVCYIGEVTRNLAVARKGWPYAGVRRPL